ncbi:MAG: hypothetical protein SVR08_16225 [Spirochaetota bacterium]|nr:hypothetical protein [Spirochaetota bacterium]
MKIIRIHIVILLSLSIFNNCKRYTKGSDVLNDDSSIKTEQVEETEETADWIEFGKMPIIWQIWKDNNDRVLVWVEREYEEYESYYYIQIYSKDFNNKLNEYKIIGDIRLVSTRVKKEGIYILNGYRAYRSIRINDKKKEVRIEKDIIHLFDKNMKEIKKIDVKRKDIPSEPATSFDFDEKGNIYVRYYKRPNPESVRKVSYFNIFDKYGKMIKKGIFVYNYESKEGELLPISPFDWFYHNGYIYDYNNTVKKVSLETFKYEIFPFKSEDSEDVEYFCFYQNYYLIFMEKDVEEEDKYYYKLQLYSKDLKLLKESKTYKSSNLIYGKDAVNYGSTSAVVMKNGIFYVVDSINNRILRISPDWMK